MTDFYVVKIADNGGAVLPDTAVYGNVEVRRASSDRRDEKAAISESVAAYRTKTDHEIASRVCAIVQAGTIDEAIQLADERFVPVMDLLSTEYALGQFGVLQCGYVKNLETGEITPIKDNTYGPSLAFVRAQGLAKKIKFEQWILTQKSELAQRYMRSIHWTRGAKWEKNIQSSVLYKWFSMEALFKENVDDDITGLLMLFLGFPGGSYSQPISRALLARLATNAAYEKWKRRIKTDLDRLRDFRNDSVHGGFRNVDYTRSELSLYHCIMTFAASRSQAAVRHALLNRLKTVSEFKDYAGIIFESRENLEVDIIDTIIFSLDNDHFGPVRRSHV
ncbi:Uncharacterised protein [Burkholderia pseudomallei]|uniref:HEPN domain-containing protein n=1 Tax=Burkholderia pseudomallei TaxID=28450 RepID=UPI000F28AA17|nr:HEPN domain-containing protein [Burkholderia pseudomallei]VBR62533.1 Uncharacterised protein [Burkholderia pseudomallei]